MKYRILPEEHYETEICELAQDFVNGAMLSLEGDERDWVTKLTAHRSNLFENIHENHLSPDTMLYFSEFIFDKYGDVPEVNEYFDRIRAFYLDLEHFVTHKHSYRSGRLCFQDRAANLVKIGAQKIATTRFYINCMAGSEWRAVVAGMLLTKTFGRYTDCLFDFEETKEEIKEYFSNDTKTWTPFSLGKDWWNHTRIKDWVQYGDGEYLTKQEQEVYIKYLQELSRETESFLERYPCNDPAIDTATTDDDWIDILNRYNALFFGTNFGSNRVALSTTILRLTLSKERYASIHSLIVNYLLHTVDTAITISFQLHSPTNGEMSITHGKFSGVAKLLVSFADGYIVIQDPITVTELRDLDEDAIKGITDYLTEWAANLKSEGLVWITAK